MGLFIKFVKNVVRKTAVGSFMIHAVLIRGWDEKLYTGKEKRQYRKDAESPAPDMLRQRKFFKANKDRLKKCISCLEDDESRECYRKAVRYRCSHNRKDAPCRCRENRYFVRSIFGGNIYEDAVLIDGGAFVGDTVREFYRLSRGKYKKILAFEPDTENFIMLNKLKYPRVYKYNVGLWSSQTELKFFENGSCGSKIVPESDEHAVKIKTEALDHILECQDATFLKLDVEGAELEALKGAENLIRRNKPKLAVCIYHSCEDMIRIIEYLHDTFPDYHLYVRHHSYSIGETVLYGVCKND